MTEGHLAAFGRTAKDLSRNPVGIIALFIVMIYGMAALVLGFGADSFEPQERLPLIWFLAVFPLVVLGVFAWLVVRHHTKLYGPADFREERHFLAATRRDLLEMTFAAPNPEGGTPVPDAKGGGRAEGLDWVGERDGIYKNHRGIFIAHVLTPSQDHGQEFNIFIYLIRHKSQELADVEGAHFFFGHYWGNEVFVAKRSGHTLGVRTAAYGPFLCTCRVLFKDGHEVRMSRYIDFEMGTAMVISQAGS